MSYKNEETFTISLSGDISGDKLYGTFKAKRRLSHRDRLAQDKMRRDLLGSQSADEASVTAQSTAIALSEIAVRLTSAPEWFSSSNNGLDLVDSNIISEIYTSVLKIENDAIDEVKKKAEEAEKSLKEMAVKDEVK